MKLAIITHVTHIPDGKTYFGYSAYVREMNLWGKYASELRIAAPLVEESITKIHMPYDHESIILTHIPNISFTSMVQALRSVFLSPLIAFRIWKVMRAADHIHLRCPGTIGLIACCVQVLFPKKPKTAKYAGNWDPRSKQPLSYRLQKKLLSNTFLTRNMKVLVYGEWVDQTKNVVPFFTASYHDKQLETPVERSFDTPIRFMFAGSLSVGKRPVYALELIASLSDQGVDCHLDFYGDGVQREALQNYIEENGLEQLATLHGNETAAVVEKAYKNSDFLILPSKSEGWPKVVAEAMFWGCIPVATRISCVPWMLAEGERGVLLDLDKEKDTRLLLSHIADKEKLATMAGNAHNWSKHYTLDRFEAEIGRLLQ